MDSNKTKRLIRNFIVGFLRFFVSDNANCCRILMYHGVTEGFETQRLMVCREEFEKQMAFLRENGYRVLSLRECFDTLKQGSGFEGKCVVITFDDGYENNYLYAYPVLKKYDYKATVFLTTDYLGNGRIFGWLPDEEIYKCLNHEQIYEMRQDLVEFASHTSSHPFLSKINDEQAAKEIGESKGILEDLLKTEVSFFAYPAGDFLDVHKSMVENAGYLAACSIRPGCSDKNTDFFALNRTEVSGYDDIKDFDKKLKGYFDILHLVIQKLKSLSFF